MNDRDRELGIVKLRCPRCNRFLADVRDFGLAVCGNCGSEVSYRSREERLRTGRLTTTVTAARIVTT